jgi:hypothetical protein
MQDYFEELGGGVSSDVLEETMDSRQIQMLTDQVNIHLSTPTLRA